MKKIYFKDLPQEQKQAWADFCIHERERHMKDIEKINIELIYMFKEYGITPSKVYLDTWIEIMEDK